MARSTGRVTGKQRSVDSSRFAMVPRNDVPRSAFDISHTHKTTFDAGWLVPVYVDEVLPGDSIRLRMTAFVRLATPIVPLMDNLHLESFFFFVPNRLLWDNWERFMGAEAFPGDTTSFLVPQVQFADTDLGVGTLPDYMGITVNNAVVPVLSVSALPFRAYNLIYNEWFRDQDLMPVMTVSKDDGPDAPGGTFYQVLHRGKRHDYFTSARPWPQKPIHVTFDPGSSLYTPGGLMTFPESGAPVGGIGRQSTATATPGPVDFAETGGRDAIFDQYYLPEDIRVRASDAGYPDVRVLIADIRTANTVQLLLEKNARGGTRYAEIIRSHFGVVSPDARLQRPEYLGGGRASVVVNPVAQTSASGATGSTTVLGELAGVGTAVASGHGFSQSFTEHGIILGIVSVRADLTYQQGINRMWFRRTQYDFYWPSLANLGEQPILSREIYADGTVGDLDVFGYQERWSEYKYKPNRISGRFRSGAPQDLDVWHLAQEFTARPALNATFIDDSPPVDRVLQVGGQDWEQFLFDSVFDVRMVRAMPMFSIPGLGPRT